MSPLVGVFVMSLVASLLYTKYDDKAGVDRIFETLKPLLGISDHRQTPNDDQPERNDYVTLENGLEDVSDLDVCIFLVVARNQKHCTEQTDDSLNRLTMLLLHCQVKLTDSPQLRQCTPEQTFSECSSHMDEADWMTFETLKKRALTVCQEVSQQLFLLKSERHVRSLMEMTQLQSSFLSTFKDSHKLLENITSRAVTFVRVQSRLFLKDMRKFRKYFSTNKTFVIEAVKVHISLLAEQNEIVRGLGNDMDVLAQTFLRNLEILQSNFSTFSGKIIQKHNEIMANLDRVKAVTDKILKEIGPLQEPEDETALGGVLSCMEEIVHSVIVDEALDYTFPILLLLCFAIYFRTYSRMIVCVLIAAGIVAKWFHVVLFGFLYLATGRLNSLRMLLVNKCIAEEQPDTNELHRSSSNILTGMLSPTTVQGSDDVMNESFSSVSAESEHESSFQYTNELQRFNSEGHEKSSGLINQSVSVGRRRCTSQTRYGAVCRRRVVMDPPSAYCYQHRH